MKLISLYIENFGGLHQYSLDFSEGLTVIQEANGFGKTTLAEFIRAMFYGFPRKAKTLDKNRRQKYTPWQGGKFGGNLTFEVEGKAYRMERTFGVTPKGDHFQLIDLSTNKKSDRFSEEIGLEIFGLDADSFERSTYLPQIREKVNLTTDSIRAKLGDLVEDTGDVGNFEKAITALKNKRSSFIPYRGNGGIVGDAASRISQLQDELDRTIAKEGQLKTCRAETEVLDATFRENQKHLNAVRKEITAASEMAAVTAVRDQYKTMKDRLTQKETELETVKDRYPAGIPDGEALELAIDEADKKSNLMARDVTGPEDLAAVRFVEENRTRFKNSIPAERELENCRMMVEDHRLAQVELKNTTLTQGELEQYRKAKELEDAGALDEKRLEKLAQGYRELEKVRGLLENMEAPVEEPASAVPEKSMLPAIALLAVGLLGMVAGIVLLAVSRFVPGGVILGMGLIGLVAGIFGAMKTMMAREMARQRQVQAASAQQNNFIRKRAALEEQARTLESDLYRALDRRDFQQAIEQLRLTRSRYLDLLEKVEQIQKKQEIIRGKIQENEQMVRKFLERYYESVTPEQFGELLTNLRRMAEAYCRSKAIVEAWQQRKAQWEKELALCNEKLKAFFESWKISEADDLRAQLRQIRDDCRSYEDLAAQREKLLRELESFAQEHAVSLENPLAETDVDLDALKNREEALVAESSELTRQLLQKRQQTQELRSRLERIPELQNELELCRIQKTEGQTTAQLLDETMEFLQMAKDSLSSNYLGPIQRSFRDYLKMMTCEDEKVLITGDLDVQLERQGQVRELGYFSAGQMDAVMLCMRFALVDALFTEEKSFVILDDPFVNLDDCHMAQALDLLRTLSEQRQILYMTCNSSRV